MPGSILALVYDTSLGKWFAQKLGGDQLSDGAINSLALITDGLFAGATGLGKFADGFLSGSAALAKFGTGLFTADATGRGKFADQFVASSLIALAAVGTPHIAAAAIVSSLVAPLALGGPHLAWGSLTSGKYAGLSVQSPDINWGAVTSGKFGEASVHTAALMDVAVTSAKVAPLAVGTGHLALNSVVSGKLGSGAIPDLSVSEAQLVSGISIDWAEMLSEPTAIAAEAISGHACILFLSGFAGKRVGVAFANNPNRMPAVGKIGATAVASGAAMTTNPILAYGRQTSPIGSGNVGKQVYVSTVGQPTVSGPSASGNLVQLLGQVMDNDGTMFLIPQPFFIAIAA